MKGRECCGAPCRFWREFPESADRDRRFGQCRRRPPTFSGAVMAHEMRTGLAGVQSLSAATSFPVTTADDWCGEYEHDGFQGVC